MLLCWLRVLVLLLYECSQAMQPKGSNVWVETVHVHERLRSKQCLPVIKLYFIYMLHQCMSFNKWYMYIYTRMYHDITTHSHLQSMFHRILWHLCWVAIFLGSDKLHHPAKTCWNNTQQQHRNNILFGPRQNDFNMIKPFYFNRSNHLIEENLVWMCKSKPMHQWYSLNKKTYVSVSLPCLGPKNQAVSHYVYIYTCNIYHYHGALLVHYFETSPKKGHGTVHCRHVLTFGGFKILVATSLWRAKSMNKALR